MDLLLLKAASDAANTTARGDLLEGLVDGDERQIIRALERHPEHADLLDDDFFWCYMGLGLTMGSTGFWRAIGDWGYSLDSIVRPPPAQDEDRQDYPASQGGMTLAQWGVRFLPLDRLEWLEEKNLLKPWEQTDVALNGMLYNSREVSDWLQESWKKDRSLDTNSWKRRLPPSTLVKLGKIASSLGRPQPFGAIPGVQKAKELQSRYENFCTLYLECKHPELGTDTERKKAFLKDLPSPIDGADEFSEWLVGSAPEMFSPSWPSQSLSTKQESWVWAKALWKAGAPAGGPGTPGVLLSKATEIMALRNGDAKDLVKGALREWARQASKKDTQDLLEGPDDSGAAPLWQFATQGQWKLVSAWISLGAKLDRRNHEGASIGAELLSLALNGDPEPARAAWDAYRKRALSDDPKHPHSRILKTKGEDLEWFVQEEEGHALATEAIMHGTLPLPAKESIPFRGRF